VLKPKKMVNEFVSRMEERINEPQTNQTNQLWFVAGFTKIPKNELLKLTQLQKGS
jgi:hypothetical protein